MRYFLKNILKKSFIIISFTGFILIIIAYILSNLLSDIFVGYDQNLKELTQNGFKIFSLSYLIEGINIFSAAFFTALNNGIISATISFLRTFLFQVITVLILPLFWEIDGIWAAVFVAEFLELIISIIFLVTQKEKYNY